MILIIQPLSHIDKLGNDYEKNWTTQSMDAFNEAFKDAAGPSE